MHSISISHECQNVCMISNKIQAAFYMDECLFHCLLGLLLFGQNMQCVLNWHYCEIAIELFLFGC